MLSRHLVLALVSATLATASAVTAEISIHGQVADAAGTPVEGATAYLDPPSTAFERAARSLDGTPPPPPVAVAISDASGRFELRAPGPGVFEVTVTAEGHLAQRRRLPPLVEATELDTVELERGGYYLRVKARGFAPYVVPGLEVVFDSEGEADLGTVVLEGGVRVAGRIVGPGGAPIEGASVNYDSWASRGELQPWEVEDSPFVKTDADGHFVIADRQAGEKLDLWAWGLGYAEGAAHGVECPSEDVEIVLEPTQAVYGRVVAPDGAAVEGARVWAGYTGRSGDRYSQGDRTDAAGRFELKRLEAGRLEVRVTTDGYPPLEQWIELGFAVAERKLHVDASIFDLELVLRRGGSIAGRVLGLDPLLYANVQVRASRLRDRTHAAGWRSSQVDFEGRIRLANLAPGEWTVEALEPGTSRRARGWHLRRTSEPTIPRGDGTSGERRNPPSPAGMAPPENVGTQPSPAGMAPPENVGTHHPPRGWHLRRTSEPTVPVGWRLRRTLEPAIPAGTALPGNVGTRHPRGDAHPGRVCEIRHPAGSWIVGPAMRRDHRRVGRQPRFHQCPALRVSWR